MENIPSHNNFPFDNFNISSDFDSGNIGNVQLITKTSLALWITSDFPQTASYSFRTWFYFKVTSHDEQVLNFTIKNLNNQSKLFSEGMKPVYKSSDGEWKRVESLVSYSSVCENFEVSFSHSFSRQSVFFAFSYPWSLTENNLFISKVQEICEKRSIYFSSENLINSLEGRPCNMLTITSLLYIRDKRERKLKSCFPADKPRSFKFSNKQVVFVTARVHPGETQSSHILNGFINFITSEDKRAVLLRDCFIFKIVPILNPDGVFRGYFRGDSKGLNLNRYYQSPSLTEHPTIYAVKQVVKYYKKVYDVFLYLDLHGHAAKKGAFLYGNYMNFKEQIESCLFAKLMQMNCINFDFTGCNFTEVNMRGPESRDGFSKEGSGRVTFFKELGLIRSYTLECNYNSSRILNKINNPESDLSYHKSQLYSEGKPKLDLDSFENIGKAIAVSLIDMTQVNPLTRINNFNELRLDTALYISNLVPFRYDPAIKKACRSLNELENYLTEIDREKETKKARLENFSNTRRFSERRNHRNSGSMLFKKPVPEPLQKTQLNGKKVFGNTQKNKSPDNEQKIISSGHLPQIKPISNFRGRSINPNTKYSNL